MNIKSKIFCEYFINNAPRPNTPRPHPPPPPPPEKADTLETPSSLL